jgi:hypothetical protein
MTHHAALNTYLNDHLGVIAGELELVKRMQSENAEHPLASFLAGYLIHLSAQEQTLKRVLATTGGGESRVKQAAGWLLEKVGRLKVNESLLNYSALSRLVELETLASAAQARLCLWSTLEVVLTATPLAVADFAALRQATQDQLLEIQTHRLAAAPVAFA